MIKSFSSNLFLVSILITVLSIPIASFNFVQSEPNVLGNTDYNTYKLEQTISEQKIIIENLVKENELLREEIKTVIQELEIDVIE